MLTAPPASDFLARYPAFAGASEDLINHLLQEALGAVDESWLPVDRKPALLAYAAHLLMVERMGAQALATPAGGSLQTSGPLTSVEIDGLKASFSDGATSGITSQFASTNGLSSTPYGRRYLELLRRNKPPVLVV